MATSWSTPTSKRQQTTRPIATGERTPSIVGLSYGVSALVRSGFLRVVTPPRVLLTQSLLAPNGSKQESWYGRLLDPASRQQWLGREPCHISRRFSLYTSGFIVCRKSSEAAVKSCLSAVTKVRPLLSKAPADAICK